jgi:hypothetical protein
MSLEREDCAGEAQATIENYRPRPLVREGAPHQQTRNRLKIIKDERREIGRGCLTPRQTGPDGCLTPRQTGPDGCLTPRQTGPDGCLTPRLVDVT